MRHVTLKQYPPALRGISATLSRTGLIFPRTTISQDQARALLAELGLKVI